MKKLYRSRNNRIWKGILGGFGEYFNIDPVLLRAAFIFLVFITGFAPGVLAYIISIFIIPNEPDPNAPIKVKAEEVKKDEAKKD